MSVEWAMEGVLRCVLTCLLGMSAVVMMDTHWMEMECLAMVSNSTASLVHNVGVRMGSGESF